MDDYFDQSLERRAMAMHDQAIRTLAEFSDKCGLSAVLAMQLEWVGLDFITFGGALKVISMMIGSSSRALPETEWVPSSGDWNVEVHAALIGDVSLVVRLQYTPLGLTISLNRSNQKEPLAVAVPDITERWYLVTGGSKGSEHSARWLPQDEAIGVFRAAVRAEYENAANQVVIPVDIWAAFGIPED